MIRFPLAKINLGLRIISKRSDAYHNIESVFYPVGIHDILEIIISPDKLFTYTGSGLAVPGSIDQNLIVKAYNLMKSRYNLPGVRIHLHKVIPMGSGTGGGSSDAASAILLLNDLFQLHLSLHEMEELAGSVGSDCPFFIESQPKFVTGRGEFLEPVNVDLSAYSILLVFPGISISTKDAYQKVTPMPGDNSLKDSIKQDVNQWRGLIFNDFEEVVFMQFPELERIKQQLYALGAVYASLTGSGSALYGLFKEVGDLSALSGKYYTYLCQAKALL
ncbi:MAG: 4-(cytidine 5'-diphospho)-2-C-methyl-D-erythritol kinase [Bacteroidales bacterium]